jgi:protein-S-isoprenylcysteine O-methyltransferase Ste14
MIFGGATLGFYMDSLFFPLLVKRILFHLITLLLGGFLLFLVLKISRNTGKILAKYGREGDLPRMETNVLVKEGPYKYMRHPMHLGLFFFPLSIALILGSPAFIFFIAPLELLFMLIMVKMVEEPEARRKFGEAYDKYVEETPGFCFKSDCLRSLFRS